ncbi:MAG TPA: VWA domain-containing protein, partial [Pyrinomonadaceae bacterium]
MLFVIVFLSYSAAIFAQNTPPLPQPTPPDAQEGEQEVVRITTDLVQIDAVVTDREGNQVTNLTAADFELLQDGKPQKISNFSYVNSASPNQPTNSKSGKNSIPSPPVRVRPENAGRIITFIIDDGNCAASQVGMLASKSALEKFVNEQMQPGDLVAIYQTRAGSSVFQQYTSDKAQLLRGIGKIRWYPPTGTCAFGDGSFYDEARSNTFQKMTPNGTQTVTIESSEERRRRESSEDFNRNNQIVGTIGVLRYVVRGLERVGGRKVVFLLSDGMPFRSRDGKILSAVDVLRDLTDSANRSSVVFNTIDVRGLFSTSMIEARDEVLPELDPNASDKVISARMQNVKDSREGLSFLADETGGKFYQG